MLKRSSSGRSVSAGRVASSEPFVEAFARQGLPAPAEGGPSKAGVGSTAEATKASQGLGTEK